jgi:hypothetical protein
VTKRTEHFTANSEIHQTETRQHADLHQPLIMNLSKYQTVVYCMGINVYNALPPYIKIESNNPKRFKKILNESLIKKNTFYSLNEYFEQKPN